MPHSGRAHRDRQMRRGRKGRPYRRDRANLMATAPDTCWYCGHPGANELGHKISVVIRPDLAGDPTNHTRVHGTSARCPVCPPRTDTKGVLHARACNQEAGTGTPTPNPRRRIPHPDTLKTSRRW